jgi:hypothetical protein
LFKEYWEDYYTECGYNGKSKWGFKDPRLCVVLPLYLKLFPKAQVVHIRRNPNDVAASLGKRKKRMSVKKGILII